MHSLHAAAVLAAGGNNINSCGVDAGMSQNVGKLCNILFNLVKHSCKQVPQVVRKHLFRVYVSVSAERFHLAPDVAAIDGVPCFGYKNHTALNSLLFRIAEQLLP